MKVHVEEKMLAVLVMMTLAVTVSDGQLLNKCDLMSQLNASLPSNLANQNIDWAKIICHVELSTGFNTSAIKQVMTPTGDMPDSEKNGKSRKRRSHGTSTEHHDEVKDEVEDEVKPNINAHQNNSMPGNGSHATNNFRNNGSLGVNNPKVPPTGRPMGKEDNGRRRGRSLQEFSSEESSGENPEPASPEISSENTEYKGRRHARHAKSHETSSEHHGNMDKVMFNNTAPQNQTMSANGTSPVKKHKDEENNSKESKKNGGGRRGRSVQASSSEESNEKGSKNKGPKNKPVSTVKPVKVDKWTLYGLFQLPNRIACISGSEPSLNLCNMNCISLINDDISDDITCLNTIISKALSVDGPAEWLVQKFYTGLFQKECSNVVAPDYFFNCPEIGSF